ncbi:MAG: aspartate 1-decarboxylase (aspartate alpha-decarboxylase) [Tissierellia bacterium]|nr:aspartate 1-decarboxylase (aspartate alpha-decarboxylase) [Tissierellia bacterium]
MRDYKTQRIIDIKERVLVAHKKVYAKESYIAFDTSSLDGYPPKVYYDREDNFIGKMYDEGIFELEDISDVIDSMMDDVFINWNYDDLKEFLVKKRTEFYKKLEK